jgi:glycosyltransferase involved in cell wall biosynthesis
VRIAIDARSVRDDVKSGIGNYTRELVRHLLPLEPRLRLLLMRHPAGKEPIARDARITELVHPGESKSVRTLLTLGRGRDFSDYDLYHATAEAVPLGLRCPWVVTVHDLMWLEAPALASAFLPVRAVNALWYRFNFGRAIRGASAVIAISRATADAIGRIYPERSARTSVVHHGVDHARFSADRAAPRSELDSLVPAGTRYSLMVGQGSPYKNHARMLRAFLRATADDPEHRVVLVRRFSRIDREMWALFRRDDVQRKVIAVPAVSDRVLLALYRHATMLLFASLYEGFGLPALEAMAIGTPVLASTAPALAEVVGDAALCAAADDEHDLAEKIGTLSRDAELRAALAARGRERALEFTWQRAAALTLDVYRSAMAGGHSAASPSSAARR